jgi:hypothetical protein
LCYSDISIEEACCDCSGDPVPDANRFANLCYDAQAQVDPAIPTQVVIPPTSAVTQGTFISITSNPACTYEVGVETTNNSNAVVSSILSSITDCNEVCSQYELSTDLTGGSYDYVSCGGRVETGTITGGGASQIICATQLGALNNITAVFTCGCNLTLEISRCQAPNSGTTVPNKFIDNDGLTAVGNFITIASDNCVWKVIATSTNAITATKSGIASVTSCDQACATYFIENPSSSETRTFFYTDCNGAVQTITISPTGVQAVCMGSYTQPQQFNVIFQYCECGF